MGNQEAGEVVDGGGSNGCELPETRKKVGGGIRGGGGAVAGGVDNCCGRRKQLSEGIAGVGSDTDEAVGWLRARWRQGWHRWEAQLA